MYLNLVQVSFTVLLSILEQQQQNHHHHAE
jgi:hypothetical protein